MTSTSTLGMYLNRIFPNVAFDLTRSSMRDSNGEMEEIMGMSGTLVAFDYP